MGFWRACSVSLEIERLRLASVAKWALAKQRRRTSRNQNTFERSTLIRVAGPFYLHQSQLSLPSLFLVTYSFCFNFFFVAFPLFWSRKWSKGQLRLQSLMDFLQQERQLVDPAIPRQLDPDVADTFCRFGAEKIAWNTQKRDQGARASFSELFFFCSKMLAFFCPKKEVDTLMIHFGWSRFNSFMLRCKNDRR